MARGRRTLKSVSISHALMILFGIMLELLKSTLDMEYAGIRPFIIRVHAVADDISGRPLISFRAQIFDSVHLNHRPLKS